MARSAVMERSVKKELTSLDRDPRFEYWGELVWWDPVEEASLRKVQEALRLAGFPDALARESLPRDAFSRAIKQLSDGRLIEPIDEAETEDQLKFQFTRKALEEDAGGDKKIDYSFETFLYLNKKNGDIKCDNARLKEKAEAEFDRCMGMRTPSHITALTKRIYMNDAKNRPSELRLFPMRSAGGLYFVPELVVDVNERVDKFRRYLGGSLLRIPLIKTWVGADGERVHAKGSDEIVSDAMMGGIESVVVELEREIGKFDDDTKPASMEHKAERIKVLMHKVESMAEYFGDKKEKTLERLRGSKKLLRDKVNSLMSTRDPKRKRAVID